MADQSSYDPNRKGRRLNIEHEKQILAEEERLMEEHERNIEGLKSLKRMLYDKQKPANEPPTAC